MIIYFSKVIKAGERKREFNFRQLPNSGDERYSVDVPDDKGNRVIFQMFRSDEGRWKTASEALPVWIQNAEADLGNIIEEHTTDATPPRRR